MADSGTALFGQSGCTEATSQSNYIAQDDDVWLYTGITSVTATGATSASSS